MIITEEDIVIARLQGKMKFKTEEDFWEALPDLITSVLIRTLRVNIYRKNIFFKFVPNINIRVNGYDDVLVDEWVSMSLENYTVEFAERLDVALTLVNFYEE